MAELTPRRAPTEPAQRRVFDFLVIGAARSGTTSLWRALDSHPQIRVPTDKEREFFGHDQKYERGADAFIAATFGDARPDQRLGTVTPQLMPPGPREIRKVVSRIAETCPDVKLLALLRDPIERAVSQFRRMKKVSDGKDENFEAFIRRLTKMRGSIDKIPLVQAGDYGRILRFYAERFDREQIRIFFTEDLDRSPDSTYREIFAYLEVDPNHSPGAPRIHVGGTHRRVAPEALDELLAELDRSVWATAIDQNTKRGFAWWLRHVWNCEPDQLGIEMSTDLRRVLARRYLRDAKKLREDFDIDPPWLKSLRGSAG
jgi:Sulfotransferase domain